jgi:hypothetical protein
LPLFEALESRRLLANFVVTNTGDNNGVNPKPGANTGTLRQAIVDANDAPNPMHGLNQIVFAIGNGVQTIQPLKAGLPAITKPVIIDGTSPANFSKQKIVIDGSRADAGADGLTITAGGSTVLDLTINQFKAKPGQSLTGDGIVLSGDKGGNTIQSCYLGTDASGAVARPNQGSGVVIKTRSNGNTIGGAAGFQDNVISGNVQDGIKIFSSGNSIQDNFIGTDSTGMNPVPNNHVGMDILRGVSSPRLASENTIGGLTATPGQTPGNVISANDGDGVDIGGRETVVLGNIIGLNLAGNAPLGNKGNGVNILGRGLVTIGGSAATARNVISANGRDGVLITDNTDLPLDNVVQSNFIGTDITGRKIATTGLKGKSLGNSEDGVDVRNASGVTIGGLALTPGAAPGNVISGNGHNGVEIVSTGTPTSRNSVLGNIIGADVTGKVALGNTLNGVLISRASRTTIGGVLLAGPLIAQPSNLIAGSNQKGPDGNGVKIAGAGADNNLVLGNTIGGSSALGNMGAGVYVDGGNGNIVGGKPGDPTVPRSKNTISWNRGGGVVIKEGTGDSIDPNGIFDNAPGLGIDLGDDGVTLNDSHGHIGPNNYQNFPVLSSATISSGGSTVITGTLNSTPDSTFSIEFYDNTAPNPSGYGEGETFLGSLDVTTDSNGSGAFIFDALPGAPAGHFIAATATDMAGNTSEFSADVPVKIPVTWIPVAVNDAYTTVKNTPLVVPAPGVLANDTDPLGRPLTAALATGPVHGVLALRADGSLNYTPNAGFTGLDTFTYWANNGLANSNLATVTVTVAPLLTITTVNAEPEPAEFGQAVTLTANVVPEQAGSQSPSPIGTVQFQVDGASFGAPVPLSAGAAWLITTALPTGPHTIGAVYSGDDHYNGSTGTASEQVTPDATVTTLSSDNSVTVYGQAVTFTATVTVLSPGAGTPTGTVQFQVDGADLGAPVPLAAGAATSGSIATLAPGPHTITALYSGDGDFLASTVGLTQTVSQAASATTVASADSAAVYGEPLTFTAVVGPISPGAGTPTGTVAFHTILANGKDVTLGFGTLDAGGTAVFQMPYGMAVGSRQIYAVYLGDTDFAGSTSATITQAVNQAATTAQVSTSASEIVSGQSITLTDSVSPVPPGSFVTAPTGTLTLYDTFDGVTTLLSTLPLGQSTVSFPSLTAVGVHSLYIVYSGDGNFLGSTSQKITVTVDPSV